MLRTIFREANDDRSFTSAINHTQEAWAYEAIIRSLVRSMAASCNRTLDAPSDDRASLPQIFDRLLLPDVTLAILDEAQRRPDFPRLYSKNRQYAADALKAAKDAYQSIDQDAKQRLKDFRNRHESHLLIGLEEVPHPSFGDLLDTIDTVIGIVANLDHAVLGGNLGEDDIELVWRVRAKSFWSRLVNGVPDEGIEDALREIDKQN